MNITKHLSTVVFSIAPLAMGYFWYQGDWKMTVIFALIGIPMMIISTLTSTGASRYRTRTILEQLILYLPLVIYTYARLYQSSGLLLNGEVIHSFDESLYFSIVTWTTLGYGDIQPVKEMQLWAAAQALVGYIYMAMLVAGVFSALSFDSDKKGEEDET